MFVQVSVADVVVWYSQKEIYGRIVPEYLTPQRSRLGHHTQAMGLI